jgi:hypothetical protein
MIDNAQDPRASPKKPIANTLVGSVCLLEACRLAAIGPTVNKTPQLLSSRISRISPRPRTRSARLSTPALRILFWTYHRILPGVRLALPLSSTTIGENPPSPGVDLLIPNSPFTE